MLIIIRSYYSAIFSSSDTTIWLGVAYTGKQQFTVQPLLLWEENRHNFIHASYILPVSKLMISNPEDINDVMITTRKDFLGHPSPTSNRSDNTLSSINSDKGKRHMLYRREGTITSNRHSCTMSQSGNLLTPHTKRQSIKPNLKAKGFG